MSQQAVCVFVGAALPGGIGMSKVELEVKGLSNKLVVGKLLAVIGGEGMHFLMDGQQELTETLANGGGCST